MTIRSFLSKLKSNYYKSQNLGVIKKKLGPEVSEHPFFKNNDVLKCFEQKSYSTENNDIIKRIITSYNKAKLVQKTLPTEYQVGNEWLPIYNRQLKEIMNALELRDELKVKAIYENFMRDDCSTGLHGLPVDMNKIYFGGKISDIDSAIYMYDTAYRYIHWTRLTKNKYPSTVLQMPNFGNPYGSYDGKQFIRTGAEYFHYYATQISDLLADQEKKCIVELGGGYGGLGYFLSKNISDLTYVDFDLPENMALTAFFLLSSFPEKKVLLYGEDVFSEASINNYDIVIMPNFELRNLPSESVDLVFNSYSLAEMSTETINAYIPELTRACKNYFLHINHAKISHSLKADDFGISSDEFQLLSREPALWNMGRNVEMDECEYLYKKKVSKI
ncbi:putative sugar O-methyltransferase [Pedobacter panaciterrae]